MKRPDTWPISSRWWVGRGSDEAGRGSDVAGRSSMG